MKTDCKAHALSEKKTVFITTLEILDGDVALTESEEINTLRERFKGFLAFRRMIKCNRLKLLTILKFQRPLQKRNRF